MQAGEPFGVCFDDEQLFERMGLEKGRLNSRLPGRLSLLKLDAKAKTADLAQQGLAILPKRKSRVGCQQREVNVLGIAI